MKNATLRQLRVFASVARHLSFIRAAEELKLSAPAVSMQIKELETEVGLPLFDRTSRQVSLTMVGEYMLAHTRRVLSAMRDAVDLPVARTVAGLSAAGRAVSGSRFSEAHGGDRAGV